MFTKQLIYIVIAQLWFCAGGNLWAQNQSDASQNVMLKEFKTGNYQVFKVKAGKITAIKKTWPVNITRNTSNQVSKITINRAGILLEGFVPDLAAYPAYFAYESYRVTFKDGFLFYYAWYNDQATIKYILSANKKPDNLLALKENLEKYILVAFKNQKNARTQLAKTQTRQAARNRVTHSLKGKAIASIKIKWVNIPDELGHSSQIMYGLEATTHDGKSYKTNNIGGKTPWEDFKVTVVGGDFGEEKISIAKDCKAIFNDRLLVKVTSKYHPHIQTSKSLNVKYNASVYLQYNGEDGGMNGIYVSPGFRGHAGQSLIIKVKQTKHRQTGRPLNQVEVRRSNGQLLHRLKLAYDATLVVNTRGGAGSFGRSSTSPGQGGNGGNILLVKDPSVRKFTTTFQNQGGRGGKHQNAAQRALSGRPGQVRTQVRALTFSW